MTTPNDTHLDHVKRHVQLGPEAVQVDPGAWAEGQAVHAPQVLVEVDQSGDVVLLHHREAGAAHRRMTEAVEELLVKQALGAAGALSAAKILDQVVARSEDGVTLAKGDPIRHVPRHLAQCANHALERALRALTGEGGLGPWGAWSSASENWLQT